MGKPIKLFIVEGENRDYRIAEEMTKLFFSGEKCESMIITLPAARNIYMLYQELKKDDFDTDVVEILRDTVDSARNVLEGISCQDISEIYMFFDYDIQQDNIHARNAESALAEMLNVFNNETEHGRLYISYPMVEALYDYRDSSCEAFSSCFVTVGNTKEYKKSSGNLNQNASKHQDVVAWKSILNTFYLRIKCLLDYEELTFEEYQNEVNPQTIHQKERDLVMNKEKVFVLSAFPEFLFDYFKKSFWKAMTHISKPHYDHCEKKSGKI